MNAALTPSFDNPVIDSQRVFRQALSALSEPGLWREVSPLVHAPAPLPPAMASLLLALCDRETPVWLCPTLRTSDVADWLRFHLACPLTDDPVRATFAAVASSCHLPALEAFAPGSMEYPDQSTTILLFSKAAGPHWQLSGPGISGTRIFRAGLNDDFAISWQANARLYPCGVDMLLTTDTHIAGLPRTTRLEAVCM